MVLNNTKPVQPDRSKIHMDDPEEVRLWMKHFEVSADVLRQTVDRVGNSVATIRKELAAKGRLKTT